MNAETEIDDLAQLAEETAAEVRAERPEFDEALSGASPEPDAPARPEAEGSEASAGCDPAALDEVIAAEADAQVSADEPALVMDITITTPPSPVQDVSACQANREVQECLVADGTESTQDAETSDAGAAGCAPHAAEGGPQEDPVSRLRDLKLAVGNLCAGIMAILARGLEAVLVRLDAPVAGMRDGVKSLIGYVALGTLLMAIVTWLIAVLR